MKETDLWLLVKPFLQWKFPEASIHCELDDRDAVVFQSDIIHEFELKLSLNKSLIQQLCSRDKYRRADYTYAVVPVSKKNQERDLYHLFYKMGWGLITVDIGESNNYADYPMQYCNVAVEPKLQIVQKKLEEPVTSILFEKLQQQSAGSVRIKKFTGFKAELESIYFALKGLNRPRSKKAIKSLLALKDTCIADHNLSHRLMILEFWGILTVTKRGRTSLYVENKLGDEQVTKKILNGKFIR